MSESNLPPPAAAPAPPPLLYVSHLFRGQIYIGLVLNLRSAAQERGQATSCCTTASYMISLIAGQIPRRSGLVN